ncbi:myo-inositol transporter 1 [Trichomonascus vanleenenianus]|uniref:sugar porter family MFS transporter n=1 Tax=Trichomonascus vanleenenianus TaxID=2268995 RepID=UPI003ECB4FA0
MDNQHAIEVRSVSRMMMALTVLTSFCGFLFGYDTGYISGALVVIGRDLSNRTLSTGDKELITSATSLGALIFALVGGPLADFVGRKWTITGANVLFIAGAICQVCAHTVWTMIAGRFVMGAGVGIASLVAPMYISEMAPSRVRGRLIVINVLAITGGQLIAYAIGAGLAHVANGWRIMVGLSLVPAVVQMVLFVLMPETPRFLVRRGRLDDAKAVLSRVYKDSTEQEIAAKVDDLVFHTTSSIAGEEDGRPWYQRLAKKLQDLHFVPCNLRALVIACGLQGIQQFSGWNSLMYFSATVFESVGFDDPTAVSIIISGTNFVFTIVAFLIIDKIGRRRMLLCTVWGMALGLVLNAIAFHFLPDNATTQGTPMSGWAIVVIISMLIYAAFYATGIGNVPWQQSEMFAMDVRSVGSAFATATNWAGSLIVSSTFLTMLNNITPTGTFAFYAGLCVLGELFVYFLYPETAGMTIEEVQGLLSGGFNVKLSVLKNKQLKQVYAEKQALPTAFSSEHVEDKTPSPLALSATSTNN